MAVADELVEVRFMAPKRDTQVFLAVMRARRLTKDGLGQEMISEWAALRRHEAMMIERLTRGNGDDSHSGFGELPD